MSEFLYRFRSIDSVLYKYQELENQEIYFAAPEQLNDPLEGYKDIFWQGDEIVWKNFLKHYLLHLQLASNLFFILGKESKINESLTPIFWTYSNLPTEKLKKKHQEICEHFFKNSNLSNYARCLSSRKKPIRKNELLFHLKAIHYHALSSVLTVFENHNLISKNSDYDAFHKAVACHPVNLQLFEFINKIEEKYQETEDIMEQIYAAQQMKSSELNLTVIYNNPIFLTDYNRQFLFLNFPEKYIKQLEKLIHPQWYAACFLSDYTDAAMWGYYGDGHKGICLKFKTQSNMAHQPIITLHGITSTGWNKSKGSYNSYGKVKHSFYKIKYSSKYPEIDFFRFLGQPTIPVLQNDWYMVISFSLGVNSLRAGPPAKGEAQPVSSK